MNKENGCAVGGAVGKGLAAASCEDVVVFCCAGICDTFFVIYCLQQGFLSIEIRRTPYLLQKLILPAKGMIPLCLAYAKLQVRHC